MVRRPDDTGQAGERVGEHPAGPGLDPVDAAPVRLQFDDQRGEVVDEDGDAVDRAGLRADAFRPALPAGGTRVGPAGPLHLGLGGAHPVQRTVEPRGAAGPLRRVGHLPVAQRGGDLVEVSGAQRPGEGDPVDRAGQLQRWEEHRGDEDADGGAEQRQPGVAQHVGAGVVESHGDHEDGGEADPAGLLAPQPQLLDGDRHGDDERDGEGVGHRPG
ncbi:hypothetical protein [Geodermatophilus obscurus]|uniref:hypothetical protein n=1 Tax=Geodermatophilus obscurus TaxID=1861 RepID=UPI00019B7E59|nr:hypothetical protein [Geodermatophilus obscurus]